jgi:hypothetical protein
MAVVGDRGGSLLESEGPGAASINMIGFNSSVDRFLAYGLPKLAARSNEHHDGGMSSTLHHNQRIAQPTTQQT